MSWDDIDDILYDGTENDMQNIKCPNCGGDISYEYTEDVNTFSVKCDACGHVSRAQGGPVPNCVNVFGNRATLPKRSKAAV